MRSGLWYSGQCSRTLPFAGHGQVHEHTGVVSAVRILFSPILTQLVGILSRMLFTESTCLTTLDHTLDHDRRFRLRRKLPSTRCHCSWSMCGLGGPGTYTWLAATRVKHSPSKVGWAATICGHQFRVGAGLLSISWCYYCSPVAAHYLFRLTSHPLKEAVRETATNGWENEGHVWQL